MGEIISDMNPNEILKCYEKALSILKSCTPPDHETTRKCLTSMMIFYYNSGNYENVLRYQLKAFDHDQ